MNRKTWLGARLVPTLLVLAACSSEESGAGDPSKPDGGGVTTPLPVTLETVPCRYVVPQSVEGADFRCGDQPVSENRAKAGTRTISLHVIVFKGKAGGVPTIMLEGGPGGSAEGEATGLAMRDPDVVARYQPFLDHGDVVMFDQRGVGRSVPRLTCVPEESSTDRDPAGTCFARLQAEGVDFEGYETAANADDVADIAKAIGARKVNLHGISYGSRLGLEVARRHPEIVASMAIDGILPPDTKIFTVTMPSFDATVSKIFTACAGDTKCKATYGDLEATLVQLKTKLDATPFTSGSYTFDWTELVGTIFDTLYGPDAAAQLPYFLHRLAGQSQSEWLDDQRAKSSRFAADEKARTDALRATPLGNEVLDRLAGADGKLHDEIVSDLAFAMYSAVSCADSGQYETLEEAIAALAPVRAGFRAFGEAEARSAFAACRTLPSFAAKSASHDPVASAVRTIVVGGELDPITPAVNARTVAATLGGSQLVIVPSGAHGLTDACGTGLKAAFLAGNATVDASCATQRPLGFYYAGQGARGGPPPRLPETRRLHLNRMHRPPE